MQVGSKLSLGFIQYSIELTGTVLLYRAYRVDKSIISDDFSVGTQFLRSRLGAHCILTLMMAIFSKESVRNSVLSG